MSGADPLYAEFLAPGPEWRGKPFWSWNGDLDEDELLRQVHVLKAMGMGGFFMHSRTGLVTEYLGDEWFRLINRCADEAAALGMEAWLYDEDRWPSGTAGGLVTEDPAHRLHYVRLTMTPAADFSWNALPEGFLAAFACRFPCEAPEPNGSGSPPPSEERASIGGGAGGEGQKAGGEVQRGRPTAGQAGGEGQKAGGEVQIRRDATDVRPLTVGEPIGEEANRTILLFSVEEMAPSSFYNGYTYVDTMSRAATDAFLAVTHEKYARECGARLGTSIRGIFTDEPHRGAVMSGFSVPNADARNLVPWTAALPAEYAARFGRDLIADLPSLFLRVDGAAISPAKWRYMELTQQLFLAHFLRPLHDWCEAHRLRLTGHVLHEDSLTAQAAMQGSMMRTYEFLHDPGIDILTEGNRAFWAAKQLQSAARQLGRKWLLSELYGCTGWQFDFRAHKAVGDWQALLGINLRCHHLSWYTMAGEAKRDYPASILHQSAWWPDYDAAVETYFSRLGLLLSQGERVCDVLVVHPVESVNARVGIGWANGLAAADPAVQALEKKFAELFGWLTDALIDFDYGDEEMLSRLAEAEEGTLRVGAARYRTVVVGGLDTVRGSTLRLLEAFAARGGRVVFAGAAPAYVDAVPADAAARFGETAVAVPWERRAVTEAAGAGAPFAIAVTRQDTGEPVTGLLAQVRRDGGRYIVALLNTDREKGAGRVTVRLSARAGLPDAVEEWDLRGGGGRVRLDAERAADGAALSWQTAFAPGGEHVYVLAGASGAPPKPRWETVEDVPLPGPFPFALGEPNVLVLDRCVWRLGGAPESEPADVLKADRALRDSLGLPHRAGDMVQPWYRRRFEPAPAPLGRVTLRFAFAVETLPEGDLFLAVERPDRWAVTVNGVPLDPEPEGWWVDTAFQKLRVPRSALRRGGCDVVLAADFSADLGLEAVYLLGDFGVRLTADGQSAVLTALPETLPAGGWEAHGLPFYGGPVTLQLPLPRPPAEDESVALWLDGLDAAVAKVEAPAGPRYLAFPPYAVPLDGAAADTFPLTVVLTRRNTFGPLHQVPRKAGAYGPGNWVTSGDGWSDACALWPAGIAGAPSILYRRRKEA